jgi:hypothetical protein
MREGFIISDQNGPMVEGICFLPGMGHNASDTLWGGHWSSITIFPTRRKAQNAIQRTKRHQKAGLGGAVRQSEDGKTFKDWGYMSDWFTIRPVKPSNKFRLELDWTEQRWDGNCWVDK